MPGSRFYAILAWLLWLLSLAVGGPLSTWIGVPLSMTVYGWCKADAAMRAVPPPPGATPLIGLSPVLGWAYYICATRSPRHSVPWILAAVLVTALGIYALDSLT